MTGLTVWVWNPVFSADFGTMVWTARMERLAELEAADDKLMASTEWGDWIEQTDSLFQGAIEDSVLQVLHGTPSDQPGGYVQVASAVCANGAMSEAMGFGVEIADTASRITGLQTMFGAGLTGVYGRVAWLTGAPDLDAVEAANGALAADDEWRKLIDRAGHAFQPAPMSTLLRRLN